MESSGDRHRSHTGVIINTHCMIGQDTWLLSRDFRHITSLPLLTSRLLIVTIISETQTHMQFHSHTTTRLPQAFIYNRKAKKRTNTKKKVALRPESLIYTLPTPRITPFPIPISSFSMSSIRVIQEPGGSLSSTIIHTAVFSPDP